MTKKFHMILRYFALKCSQIEHISYMFHTYWTTTPYFALYRLHFILFSLKIWYTHSCRVFIHLGARNIIFLHINQFLSINWIIVYVIIEILVVLGHRSPAHWAAVRLRAGLPFWAAGMRTVRRHDLSCLCTGDKSSSGSPAHNFNTTQIY